MSNLLRRVRKLEAGVLDCRGLVPGTEQWLTYWSGRLDRIVAGDQSVDLRGMSLEVIRAIIAADETSGQGAVL